MDKLGIAPQVRQHNHQSMKFINLTDEFLLQYENEIMIAKANGTYTDQYAQDLAKAFED